MDLIFDIAPSVAELDTINASLAGAAAPWSLSLTGLVLMRQGGEPGCLASMSDYEIAIQEDFEAVDRGFAETEKGSR